MNKPLLFKFRAFFIFAVTLISFFFYLKPVPDDGIIPVQTYRSVKVFAVKNKSNARKKKIKTGDTIIGVNHRLIKEIDDIPPLIKTPKSDYLFESKNHNLMEKEIETKALRRITKPEMLFIFVSLLLFILSISLTLNNTEIEELNYIHRANFLTHFATLAFVIGPTYSSFESFLLMIAILSFPTVPFSLSRFVNKKEGGKNLYSLFLTFLLILIFYLFFFSQNIVIATSLSLAILFFGYLNFAYNLKKQSQHHLPVPLFFATGIYLAIFTLTILLFITRGDIPFFLLKFMVIQQIALNGIILYNILKYGISNRPLALKKSFVDAFILLILLILYTFLIYFLNKLLGKSFISNNLKIYSIMLGILIVFILNPINEWLKEKLEYLLFKQEKKLTAKLFEMTDKMISIRDSVEIEKYIETLIKQQLKLNGIAFIKTNRNILKEINSHIILEANGENNEENIIQQLVARFKNRGFKLCYPFLEREENKIFLLTKKPLTIQQKKVLEHIFAQFALSYQNIKLIEKAQKQIELERDMKIAGLIQKSLIPSFHPEGENFEIYGISESARTVGGDFFDYLPSDDRSVKAIVGDVAGKSVPAAIMMVSAKETIFARSANFNSPSKLMRESNRLLYLRSNKNMFVACIFFVFDPENLTLTYINAGMPSPFLIRKSTISILKKQKTRFPLGLLPEVSYKEDTIKLEKGDILLFLTDGITETLGQEIFDTIENCTEQTSAIEVCKCIIKKVKEKTGNILEDDATIVVLKVKE